MAAQVGWPIGRLVFHKCQPDSVSITAIVAASVRSAWVRRWYRLRRVGFD